MRVAGKAEHPRPSHDPRRSRVRYRSRRCKNPARLPLSPSAHPSSGLVPHNPPRLYGERSPTHVGTRHRVGVARQGILGGGRVALFTYREWPGRCPKGVKPHRPDLYPRSRRQERNKAPPRRFVCAAGVAGRRPNDASGRPCTRKRAKGMENPAAARSSSPIPETARAGSHSLRRSRMAPNGQASDAALPKSRGAVVSRRHAPFTLFVELLREHLHKRPPLPECLCCKSHRLTLHRHPLLLAR
jgi:hypothetical protein